MAGLRYPIGPFEAGAPPVSAMRLELVSELAEAPKHLRAAVVGLSNDQLDTPYRPDGWTVRQVVHHLADAHMNWYIRTKLALTEHEPRLKPYDEALWAELPDERKGSIVPSLKLFAGIHERWVNLFQCLSEQQWKREMIHPERGVFVLDATLPMHVWLGRRHTAQVLNLRARNGWS
jgi:DinB superfamily